MQGRKDADRAAGHHGLGAPLSGLERRCRAAQQLAIVNGLLDKSEIAIRRMYSRRPDEQTMAMSAAHGLSGELRDLLLRSVDVLPPDVLDRLKRKPAIRLQEAAAMKDLAIVRLYLRCCHTFLLSYRRALGAVAEPG